MAFATTDAKRPRRCPEPSIRICCIRKDTRYTGEGKRRTYFLKPHPSFSLYSAPLNHARALHGLRMRISQENMAGIKDGSGIAKPKRRAWGKQRCKRDLVSIDHMDIAALTKVVEHNNKQCYAVDDLRNPESMATETLVNHLSRMKIPYASSRRGREGLLCLFRVHIQPKTQRVRFWRNKRRHEEDMEVGDTWTDCDITRKR